MDTLRSLKQLEGTQMTKRLLTVLLCALYVITGYAQPDPSTLPLLSQTSLQYLGGFRVPATSSNGSVFDFGGLAVAHNPASNTLFISIGSSQVAEVSIPTPVNSATVTSLPVAAYVQPFADPVEGRMREVPGAGLSSMVVHNNRLYGTVNVYYDANHDQRLSHFSRSLRLIEPSFSGWSAVRPTNWVPQDTGFFSGFLSAIPAEWQARLGGAVATGQCCIPIVSRTSHGPAAFAFDPARITSGATVPASPLLYYDGAHLTLGDWGNQTTVNLAYNMSTELHGFAIIAGTRTALYFGKNGIGVPCYGLGTGDKTLHLKANPEGGHYCYDLADSGKGSHAYPYRYQVWAYDLNDFAAVKAGTKKPWEVTPYAMWGLNLPTLAHEMKLGGVGYDPQRQILFLAQVHADVGDNAYRPLIHAFKVNAAGAPAPIPTPVPVPIPTPVPVPVPVPVPTPDPKPTPVPVPVPPMGVKYQAFTVTNTVFQIPETLLAGSTHCLVRAERASIRMRLDGVPSSSNGWPLPTSDARSLAVADARAARFIRATSATTATLHVECRP